MFKVAILGCENSHANSFLHYIVKANAYPDVEVVGVYSNDREAAEKLNAEFGVYVMDNYDEFVGKVDGIIITARHGDEHYKFAKPYISAGIPMFIDKPITCTEADANEFKAELKQNGVKATGGSMCMFADYVMSLREGIDNGRFGKIYGGYLRAPINMVNEYGNFFFYSQHLVQVMGKIFGNFPKSVKAYRNAEVIKVIVRYADYDVVIEYVEGNYDYYAGVSGEKEGVYGKYDTIGCAKRELDEYYEILKGGEMPLSYEDVFAPVYILNAIYRSIENGTEENVIYPED